MASIFSEHDQGETGSLYTEELRAAVEEMGYTLTDEQMTSLLTEFDFDGSSELDLLEFTALVARMLGYKELPTEQFKLLRKVWIDRWVDG